MTIIIETTTRERLVLVPPDAVSRTVGGDELLTIRTANARDATPADLLRAGYVPREVPSAEAWKAAHAEAERELIRARAALAEQPDPGTLAHLRADLRDAVKRAEKAEAARDALRDQIAAAGCEAAHAGERTYECDVARPCGLCRLRTRAEKAERERDEALLRAHTGVVHYEILRQSGEEAARQRDEARAEVARLTAPGEGSLDNGGLVAAITRGGSYRAEDFDVLDLQAAYRLGVAHERARHAPAPCTQEARATDEELERDYSAAYAQVWGPEQSTTDQGARAGIRAVAARVRQERCLVAQAVAANVDIRVCEDDGGGFMLGVHESGCDEELARCVPAADVPATLARLLGEVSR